MIRTTGTRICGLLLTLATITGPCLAGRFRLDEKNDVVTVTLDGQLFTKYLTQSGNKPILWPIIGPDGQEMTRAFPMRRDADETETTDHVHHRSLWFAHGDVNGINFWQEDNRSGRIVHKEFLKVESEGPPQIVTRNEWVDADAEKQCSDYRQLTFYADEDRRWLDFDLTVVADAGIPVVFGDTKEGCFGMRVASTMRVDAKLGGEIVNNLDMKDGNAWGKAASWVDYHGPVDGEPVGIAILNHPSSFRFPTFWHVRTYGLFAANVFGWHNFKNSHDEDGAFTLQPDESFTLSYRILIHRGNAQEGRVPEAFIEYAKLDKVPIPNEMATESAEASPATIFDADPATAAPVRRDPQRLTAKPD